MQKRSLESLCIVGGGTAGWMAASLLSSALQGSNIKITVIESPDIATIGVGESTVPTIMDFLKTCRIDLRDFMQATSATFKLGIQFENWLSPGNRFFHPFGHVGQSLQGFDFYQLWLKAAKTDKATRWLDHSPCAVMSENNRFLLRQPMQKNWVLNSHSNALHLDAVLTARYLRELSLERGVTRVEATVNNIRLNEQGFIDSLALDDGFSISSDFFIDCTGFKALLIEGALNIGYEDWSHFLPCNRAVTIQTESVGALTPYTRATARDAGWTWKIPLQHRTGNGYVYSSEHCSDEDATKVLLAVVEGKPLNEPRVIPFSTGRRKKILHKNCLSLGLSSGFLEPLESTAIHLIHKTLVHFIRYFPDKDFSSIPELAFNKKINIDYQEVRDFIILHYCTSQRRDSDFWRSRATMEIPESLREKLESFRDRGMIEHVPGQFFTNDSWYSILEGMNVRPHKYHPLVESFDERQLVQWLRTNASDVIDTVLKMPSHDDFIQQNCAAKVIV